MGITALVFCICILASVTGSISGIGGGIIIKPALDAFSPLEVELVSFLSGCTVLSMAAVSLFCGRKSAVRVEPRRGTLLAMGAALGGLSGKKLFDFLLNCVFSKDIVTGVQSILLFLITLLVLLYVCRKNKITSKNIEGTLLSICIGVGLGIVSAFLGIGGGPLNLMVLSYFFSMDSKTAARHSIYIILLSQITSLATTLIDRTVPAYPVALLVSAIGGGVFGAFIGSELSTHFENRHVDYLFSVVLLVVLFICGHNAAKVLYGV